MAHDLNLDELERQYEAGNAGEVDAAASACLEAFPALLALARKAAAIDEAHEALKKAIDELFPEACDVEDVWTYERALRLVAERIKRDEANAEAMARRAAKAEGELAELRGEYGGFGVEPTDSLRLLELRQIIDDEAGWDSEDDEEEANYPQRMLKVIGRWKEAGDSINAERSLRELAESERDTLRAELDRVTKERDRYFRVLVNEGILQQ